MCLGTPMGHSSSSTWYRRVHVRGCAFPAVFFKSGTYVVSLYSQNCLRVKPSLRVATVARMYGYLERTVSGMLSKLEEFEIKVCCYRS